MDNLVGTTIRIGTLSEFDPGYNYDPDIIPKYHSPFILSNVGIDHLLIGNISDNWTIDHSWLEWFRNLW
jgi:hypothetical protein